MREALVSWAEEKLVTGLQGKPSALAIIKVTMMMTEIVVCLYPHFRPNEVFGMSLV